MKIVSSNSRLSTREIILDAIKQANEATVDELADAAEVSPVTVRHHLNSLQAEGLLETRSIRRKVGRPYYIYSLSEKGNELFPQRYLRLSNMLLDEIKKQFPEEIVSELFSNVVNRIVKEHSEKLEGMEIEDRLNYLVKMLAEEGFLASWELTEDGNYQITEYSCPYYSVGQKHSEVCGFDRQLMIAVLDTQVTQETCMLSGDAACQFTFIIPGNGA